MTGITARQLVVLHAIRRHQEEHEGLSPSIREIAASIGVASDNGVLKHLLALQRKGAISRNGRHRDITLTEAGLRALRLRSTSHTSSLMETKSYSGGIGFVGLLTLIFITLKLVGIEPVSTWSWLWVLSPFWIGFLLWLAALTLIFVLMIVVTRRFPKITVTRRR